MPLRDHFHPPLSKTTTWEGLHGGWPMTIVQWLYDKLPPGYTAEPRVHHGAYAEIDVATFERNGSPSRHSIDDGGGVATATWAPAKPSLAIETEFDGIDEYEVQVFDDIRRLVAAIEIVSPANKDRPATRRAFIGKCRGLLRRQISVTIIDLVTKRRFNLYRELLDDLGRAVPDSVKGHIYAVACRSVQRGKRTYHESWNEPLKVGKKLPTLPLWLDEDLAIPLSLEESYESACRVLHIPK